MLLVGLYMFHKVFKWSHAIYLPKFNDTRRCCTATNILQQWHNQIKIEFDHCHKQRRKHIYDCGCAVMIKTKTVIRTQIHLFTS